MSQKNKKYIIQRKLLTLTGLNRHPKIKGFGNDSSILVNAMVDFINFSNTQPGMPFLLCEENILYLIEGVNLIEAISKSKFNKKIYCIWSCINNCFIPEDAEPFDLNFANSLGKDFRVITCEGKIEIESIAKFHSFWGLKPLLISDFSVGWDAEESKLLGDFFEWRKKVEHFSSSEIKIVAINGRKFVNY